MKEVKFTVPLVPPSVNHYVKHTKNGRHYVTTEAKNFKWAIKFYSLNQTETPIKSCEISISIFLGKGGRGDADNFAKVVLDGLVECGIILSDAKVDKVMVEKFRDWENPRTGITVREK